MTTINRIAALTFSTLLGVPLAGCSQVCGPLEYRSGASCPQDGQTIAVKAAQSRIDLTDANATLTLLVDVLRTKTSYPLTLAEPPRVELTQDGAMLAAPVQVDLQADGFGVAVRRNPEQLRLGAVDATVTISDLPSVPLKVSSEGDQRLLPRVFRSPKFVSTTSVTLPLGAIGPRSGSIRGRTAVQVAGPFAEPGRLLVTATADTVVGAVRWQELFRAQPGSQLDYDTSGVWISEQLKQQEGPTAMLAMGKGAVLIYDQDTAMGRGDLSLIPLFGTRRARLSTLATQVPKTATGLAACAEESLVFLAEKDGVQAFAFDPAPAALTLRHLQSIPVAAEKPIIAARDVAGGLPAVRSQRYAAAFATPQGVVKLVPVKGDTPATYVIDTDGMRTVDLGLSITALALADLDSDGLQDLVFAQSDGQLFWLPQLPDGGFATKAPDGASSVTPQPLALMVPNATSISVGDLNGDTWPDLAVATADQAGGVYGNAQVFFNLPR